MFTRLGTKRIAAAVVGGISTLALLVAGSAPAVANDDRSYLALGDSVVFGYITHAGFEYFNPHNFIGYPDYVSQALRFTTTNASCPGEAAASFISAAAADEGHLLWTTGAPHHVSSTPTTASCRGEEAAACFSAAAADNGCHLYRASAPLHVSYTGTQLDFATK